MQPSCTHNELRVWTSCDERCDDEQVVSELEVRVSTAGVQQVEKGFFQGAEAQRRTKSDQEFTANIIKSHTNDRAEGRTRLT